MLPKVSIVYLTKNGGDLFERSLESVFLQEAGFPFEVVAVDSGSTDGTLGLMERHAVRVEQIEPEAFNFGLARDYAFSLARGEILATLSQDAVPTGTHWLRRICEPFRDPTIAVVQGQEVPPPDRGLFFWDKIRLFYFTREARQWRKTHGGLGLSFVNCAIRQSVWESTRLGPVAMSEDKVFQERLLETRQRIVFAPEAKVWHSHLYDLKTLMRRCENEGLGWRLAGQTYSATDMLLDMFHPFVWAVFLLGLLTLQIRNPAEIAFPWVRPLFLFRGNRYASRYVG